MVNTLTTRDVAKLLQVSEATIKRWADDGLISADKTAGGHRRFSIQNVARLRREHSSALSNPTALETSADFRLTVSDLTKSVLSGDEAGIAALLIDAYLKNESLVSIFDHTITDVMHDIGDQWYAGELTVADEHLATRVMLNALQQLRSVITRADETGMSAICCGIEGDLHELPVHLVEILLEGIGWKTVNLGPNTPLFSLNELISRKSPRLLCISARFVNDLDRTVRDFGQLRKSCQRQGTTIVIGGEAIKNNDIRHRLPAELYAETFSSLLQFVATLN